MLSVVISASEDAQALARLLTALVRGVAEELVADVVVRGAAGLSLEIAEDAGATLEDGAFSAAIARTRGRWVAGLPLCAGLAPGWIEIVAEHMGRPPAAPARLVSDGGLFGRGRLEGWLVPKPTALSAGVVEQDLQRLARLGGVRRLRVLARG
jgi:hypothetical protein